MCALCIEVSFKGSCFVLRLVGSHVAKGGLQAVDYMYGSLLGTAHTVNCYARTIVMRPGS